jgi:VRR-NUC domain
VSVSSEGDVVRDCKDVLMNVGWVHWRSQSGSFRTTRGGWFRTGVKGLADLCAIIPPRGRLMMIECKKEGGRLSDDQDRFLEWCGSQGALCVVIRDSSDLMWVIDRLMENPDLKAEEL